jgi:hypothetical protein
MRGYSRVPEEHRPVSCTDPVVGAILSGWRYDISGVAPELRVDYEAHLTECPNCRKRQRIHRTVDVLLLAATTMCTVAFLLAALVMRRVEELRHISNVQVVHLRAHESMVALTRVPDSITVSLEATAITGLVISALLWVLVAMVTPIPTMVSTVIRERIVPEWRERHKAA